ncbi:hypothetical protein B0J17DRAFT_250994 [Rhizoctonia solani]|nr:hypothetical protein B0J17DRAFT_250994 [Rhizoctonia solani]
MSSKKPLDSDPSDRVETTTPFPKDCAPCQERGVKCGGISIGHISCKACIDRGIVCLPSQKTYDSLSAPSDVQVPGRQEEYQDGARIECSHPQ